MQGVLYEVRFRADSGFGFLSELRYGSDTAGTGNDHSRRSDGNRFLSLDVRGCFSSAFMAVSCVLRELRLAGDAGKAGVEYLCHRRERPAHFISARYGTLLCENRQRADTPRDWLHHGRVHAAETGIARHDRQHAGSAALANLIFWKSLCPFSVGCTTTARSPCPFSRSFFSSMVS